MERLKAEVVHWKANHDNQVRIKQMLQQRPDLGDRAQSVAQMLAENERLKAELDAVRREATAAALAPDAGQP